jgi:hypothetical protein
MPKVLAAASALALTMAACVPGAPNAWPGSISASGRGTAVTSGAASPTSEADKHGPATGSAGPAVR